MNKKSYPYDIRHMIMSQHNYLNTLKQWFILCKNKLYLFYDNYIKFPCINLYNYIFVKKINHPISIQSNIEIVDLSNSTINTIIEDNDEQSITKRISYSDNNSSDFQEISIHRQSISSCINANYLEKND
jgi:hypothetical protein